MTEKECVEKYSKNLLCHKAFVMIESKEDFKDRFLKLKELLGNVLETRYGIVVTPVNKGHYPYVAVTNKTPYDVTTGGNDVIYKGWGLSCSDDKFVVDSAQTWSATSRGFCLVKKIRARLTLDDGSPSLVCYDYKSSGTSYSQFYIIMNGDNGCCVQSDHQSGVCPSTDDDDLGSLF